jgi:hypothetical protein
VDDRLAQYEQECAELARVIEMAVDGQHADWSEQAAAAVVNAGWLPPDAVAEMIQAQIEQETLESLAEPMYIPGLVTPAALSRYLAGNGWELLAREAGVREIWDLPRAHARVLVPFATDYEDWELRWIDALCTVKTVYRWDNTALAVNLAPYGT